MEGNLRTCADAKPDADLIRNGSVQWQKSILTFRKQTEDDLGQASTDWAVIDLRGPLRDLWKLTDDA